MIPEDQIDTAALQRLEMEYYKQALRGNVNFGGNEQGWPLLEEGIGASDVPIPAGTPTDLPRPQNDN